MLVGAWGNKAGCDAGITQAPRRIHSAPFRSDRSIIVASVSTPHLRDPQRPNSSHVSSRTGEGAEALHSRQDGTQSECMLYILVVEMCGDSLRDAGRSMLPVLHARPHMMPSANLSRPQALGRLCRWQNLIPWICRGVKGAAPLRPWSMAISMPPPSLLLPITAPVLLRSVPLSSLARETPPTSFLFPTPLRPRSVDLHLYPPHMPHQYASTPLPPPPSLYLAPPLRESFE